MSDDRADDETSVLPVAALPRSMSAPPVTAARAGAPPSGSSPPPVTPTLEPGPPPPYYGPPVTPIGYPAYRSVPAAPASVGRVVLAGVVLLLFGLTQVISGAAGAIFAGALRRVAEQLLRGQGIRVEQAALGTVVAGFFVAMLLFGVLHVVAAIGLFSQRRWGRVLGMLVAAVGLAICAVLLGRVVGAGGASERGTIAALALLVPYAFSLLALVFAGAHFDRPRRQR